VRTNLFLPHSHAHKTARERASCERGVIPRRIYGTGKHSSRTSLSRLCVRIPDPLFLYIYIPQSGAELGLGIEFAPAVSIARVVTFEDIDLEIKGSGEGTEGVDIIPTDRWDLSKTSNIICGAHDQ